jgi:hypothetical protein
MAIIPNLTIGEIGCANPNCGRPANQLYRHNYPSKGICGVCQEQRTKYYYQCYHCQTITVKNKTMRNQEKEGCSHINTQIYIQGKIIHPGVEIKVVSFRGASSSAPPSEAASSVESETIGGRTFHKFL